MNSQIEDFSYGEKLGEGSFGEVFLCKRKNSNKKYAMKRICRQLIEYKNYTKYIENEKRILERLNHPNIVKFVKFLADTNYYYLITEYIDGESLLKILGRYKDLYKKSFPEEIVQFLMKQIVYAVKYIHEKNIIHRDLKLDNIMVHFKSDNDKYNINMINAELILIDFGFAVQLETKDGVTTSVVGTPHYMDPVMIKNYKYMENGEFNAEKLVPYGKEADIWSLGCICYELLTGKSVFEHDTINMLISRIGHGDYDLPKTVSKEYIYFLNNMLQYNKNNRLSAEKLISDKFLQKNVKDFKYLTLEQIQKFEEVNQIKKSLAIYQSKINESIRILKKNPTYDETKNKKVKITQSNPNVTSNNNQMKNYNIPIYGSALSFYGDPMTLNTQSSNLSQTKTLSNKEIKFKGNISNSYSNFEQNKILNYGIPSFYQAGVQPNNNFQSISNNNNNYQTNNFFNKSNSTPIEYNPLENKEESEGCIIN